MLDFDFNKIFVKYQREIFYFSIILLLVQCVFLARFTIVHNDSGMTSEPAYMLANHGYMAMPTWRGFADFEKAIYWRTPLFIYLEAFYFGFFGFGILQVTILMTIIALMLGLLIYFVSRSLYGLLAANFSLLLYSLSFPFLLLIIFEGRPDALVGILNLAATLFLVKYFESGKPLPLLIASILSSFSFLSHELGILMVASVGVVILLKRGLAGIPKIITDGLLLAGVFLLTISPWIFYILSNIASFQKQLAWIHPGNSISAVTILNEFSRYALFFSFKKGIFLPWILVFLFAIGLMAIRRKIGPFEAIILTHLMLFFLIYNKAIHYMIPILPLIILYIAGQYSKSQNRGGILPNVAALLLAILAISSFFSFFAFAKTIPPKADYLQMYPYLEAKKYDSVMVSQTSLFYVFKDRMLSLDAVLLRKLQGESFIDIARSEKIKYAIFIPHDLMPEIVPEFFNFLASNAQLASSICVNNGVIAESISECKDNSYRVDIYKFNNYLLADG